MSRVLIVDDNPEVVRMFRRMLHTRIPPQQCLEAYNGAEALALMKTHTPDLVLLDLIMPVVDGKSVLARMEADPALAAIPVIISSKMVDGNELAKKARASSPLATPITCQPS